MVPESFRFIEETKPAPPATAVEVAETVGPGETTRS
jgi:hypothetical protein